MRMKKRAAQDLEVLLPEPIPVRLTETHTIVKGSRRPNSARLFLESVASAEGQRILWDVEPFKSSIYSPGSKTEELARGKKTSLGDWDHVMKQQLYMDKLTAAFGFPREEKRCPSFVPGADASNRTYGGASFRLSATRRCHCSRPS